MANFDTTNWNLIGQTQGSSSQASTALEELCRAYWKPLFSFVRRSGYDEETSRDLVQGFFMHLVSKNAVSYADPARGRFRSFLISSLKNFVSDERDRQRSKKRSPGMPLLSLDAGPDSTRRPPEPVDPKTPETVYASRWAAQMLDQAMSRLEVDQVQRGRGDLFRKIRPHLSDSDGLPYKQVASELGMTENAIKSAVRTQRKKLGTLLREEVQEVLRDAATVDDELREILRTLQDTRGAR